VASPTSQRSAGDGSTLKRSNTIHITSNLHSSKSFRSDPLSPTKMIRDKLSGLASSFSGFEEKVSKSKKKQIQQSESKLIDIKKDISKINKALQWECKTRDDQIKTSHHALEMKIKKIKSFVEIPINKKIAAITESLEYLSNKLDEMERQENADVCNTEAQVTNSYEAMVQQFQAQQHDFDTHCLEYTENQRVLKKIISDQQSKIKRFIKAEQEERNTKLHKIATSLEHEITERELANKQSHDYCSDNIDKLNSKLRESEKERIETTEQVVKALCHYTSALQDGVQIVSSGARD